MAHLLLSVFLSRRAKTSKFKWRSFIMMDVHADFMRHMYTAAHKSWVYQEHYAGWWIVVVFYNAPAHSQTEQCVERRLKELELQQGFRNLVFLHLGPYSPMLSSIKGCFASLKAAIKLKLVHYRGNIVNFNVPGQVHAHHMHVRIYIRRMHA